MARFAHIKDGKVVNLFESTPEWATEVYGATAVPAEDSTHIGDLFDGVAFARPPRNVAGEAGAKKAEILRQLARTSWTSDPDNVLSGQDRAAWSSWRRGLRTALRTLTLEELANYGIPTPPGALDEG